MAKFYPCLNTELQEFITAQQMFFVATAPIQGRVNVSPKGIDTLLCLSEHSVAYLDLTGSGNETAAHTRENQRITVMFCSFSAKPLILRLYGKGEAIKPRDREWTELYQLFAPIPGTRQIIKVEIESVQTSCGFGVPLYEYQGQRPNLTDWAEKKGDSGLYDYWQIKNQQSIDGLPTYLLSD